MFGLFRSRKESNKHSKKQHDDVVGSELYAPNTRIRYDNNLIHNLTNEHRLLLDLYRKIEAAYSHRHMRLLPELLIEFKDLLIGHLLKENVNLYVYLKYSLQDDPTNLELMKHMQEEMGEIGRVIFRFLKEATAENAIYDDQFKKEFDGIGNALVRRIKNEEIMLYPIYLEPQKLVY